MSRELLQQALGALGTSTWDHTRAVGKQELITALRTALAQPEPEPVAHLYDDGTWIATQTAAGRSLNDRMLFAGSPKIGVYTVATPPAGPAPAICDAVAMPTNAQQAEAMMRVSSYWLQANAPELLRAMLRAPAPAPAVPLTDDMVEAEFVSRGDDKGQGLHPYWKDAFREGFNFARSQLSAAPAVPAECCRNELLTALHTLASNYENALGMFGQDGEGRRKAEGDLAHAMMVAAKHNRNGPGCAAPAVPNDAALNTLAKMFHSGEEIEGDNGAAMMVDMALWHEASEAFDSLIGEGDGETLAAAPADMVMVPRVPTHEMLYAMAELDGWRKGDRDHPMFTKWRDYWDVALAAAPAPSNQLLENIEQLPADMVMVPREPTKEFIRLTAIDLHMPQNVVKNLYSAIVAAAAPAPAAPLTTQQITQIARKHGIVYTNRHYSESPAVAFSQNGLMAFLAEVGIGGGK